MHCVYCISLVSPVTPSCTFSRMTSMSYKCQLLLIHSMKHYLSSPPIRKLAKPAGRFCVDILRAQDDRVLCGYRGRGGLKGSNRWSNGRFVGSSVLGGFEEVRGGGVAGRRKKRLRKVRFGDWIYTVCESHCYGALNQGTRKPLQFLLWVARMSCCLRRQIEGGRLRSKWCSDCNCSRQQEHVAG